MSRGTQELGNDRSSTLNVQVGDAAGHGTQLMALQPPPLREVLLSDVLKEAPPVPKIKTDEDVEFWKSTRSYSDLGLFLQRLNEAVVGYNLPFTPQSPSKVSAHYLSPLMCRLILESSMSPPFLRSSISSTHG